MLVVFGLFSVGAIVGATAMFFVQLLAKDHEKTTDERRQDVRHDEVLKEIRHFEISHQNWRSPKANKIAVEKLIERIRSC